MTTTQVDEPYAKQMTTKMTNKFTVHLVATFQMTTQMKIQVTTPNDNNPSGRAIWQTDENQNDKLDYCTPIVTTFQMTTQMTATMTTSSENMPPGLDIANKVLAALYLDYMIVMLTPPSLYD
jgi:hypothetical protein